MATALTLFHMFWGCFNGRMAVVLGRQTCLQLSPAIVPACRVT